MPSDGKILNSVEPSLGIDEVPSVVLGRSLADFARICVETIVTVSFSIFPRWSTFIAEHPAINLAQRDGDFSWPDWEY
ncbi:hypothetical protein OLK001_26180 [Synechocystis sp. LKSZ1]